MSASMLLLSLACGHPAPAARGEPDLVSARFALDIVERRVHTRDDLKAHFVVTNTGTVPLWLNGRMLLGASGSPSPFQEVWVEAKGPGPIGWWCFMKTPAVEPKHYRLVRPGDSAGRKPSGPSEDLRCLGLDSPGTYTLIAHYKDGNDAENVPPSPSGTVYLGWELVAEPVTVEITDGSATAPSPRQTLRADSHEPEAPARRAAPFE